MSLIAGTIIYTKEDQTYFLVSDDQPRQKFYTVKMHKHENDTALGSLLEGLRHGLGVDPDNLRLGEIAGWQANEDIITLYTFDVINADSFDLKRLSQLGLHFVTATSAMNLLHEVDTNVVAKLD